MSISSPKARRPANYLLRHWRGELPLDQALWMNGIAVTAMLIGLSGLTLFGRSATLIDSPADLIQLVLVSAVVLVLIPVWQLRGLWRAAERHIDHVGTLLAGRSAQVTATLLAFLAITRVAGGAVDLAMLAPQALNTGIYHSEIEIKSSGRELEIRGGFGFGLAGKVAATLADHPTIRRVRLESWGGSLHEAQQLAELITQHRLNTYSSVFCSNTCVVPFIAGGHRTIKGRGRLGFTHAYGLPISAAGLFNRQHIPPHFLVSWNRTGPRPWYPSGRQLRAGGIVHTIIRVPGP